MRSIFALGVLVLVATGANAASHAQSEADALPKITACSIAFASSASDCEAVVALGHCIALAGADNMPAESSVRQLAESLLLTAQQGKECSKFGDKNTMTSATIRSERGGDMLFNVAEEKDVKLFRFRREVVSLFGVSERLTDAEEALAAQKGAVAKNAEDLASYDKTVNLKIEAEAAARGKAIDGLTSDLTTKYATLKQLEDANEAVKQAKVDIDANAARAAKIEKNVADNLIPDIKKAQTGVERLDAGLKALTGKVDKLDKLVPADLTAQLKALKDDGNTGIHYKQCTYPEWNNGNNGGYEAMRCVYDKKADDSFLRITHFGDVRIISGAYSLRITVDGMTCRTLEDKSNNGDMDFHVHNSGVNHHRPGILVGYCERTSNNALIAKGKRIIRWMKTGGGGDHYYGWAYSQRLLIEEYPGKLRQKAVCKGRICT